MKKWGQGRERDGPKQTTSEEKIVVSKDAGARIEHVHREQNKIVEEVRAHTHPHTITHVYQS